MMLCFYIIIVSLFARSYGGYWNSFPIEIHMPIFKSCPSENEITAHIQMKKYNRTMRAYDGNFSAPYAIDKTFLGVFKGAKWSDGGWKENFFNIETMDPCGILSTLFSEAFYMVQDAANMKRGCPAPKGFYQASNYTVDWKKLNLKFWYTGRMRGTGEIFKDGRKVFCKTMEFEIAPIITY